MPIQWILEGLLEFAFEIGADILGMLFSRKRNLSTGRIIRRARPNLKKKLTGYAPDEVDEAAVIYEKPKTVSHSNADSINRRDIIKIKVMLGKDGKLKYIQLIKGAGNKQTRLAIAEVKKIRFRPARKNGYPVAQWIEFDCQVGEQPVDSRA